MEVSLLPDEFDNSIRFVYVTAWRWSSKKGIAGNIEGETGQYMAQTMVLPAATRSYNFV